MDSETKKLSIQMAYASSIGIAMVLAIFGCLLLGSLFRYGDLYSGHVFTIVFLLIGISAGFRNIYVLIQRNFKDDETIIKSLKSEPHRQRPAPKKT